MQISYVIDGYNLLHAMGILLGKVKPAALAAARVRLQEFLVRAFGDDIGLVTLVFDAAKAPPKVARQETYKGLTILLAVGNLEADDVIETFLAEHSSPKHLTVVSSDHRLQLAAKHKGARSMNCTEFLDFLENRQNKPQPRPEEIEKKEQLSDQEIRGWMQEFAGLENEPDLKEALERYDFEIEDQAAG